MATSERLNAAPGAREAGLARCGACGALQRHRAGEGGGALRCRRCGARVHVRVPHSLQRTWAFLVVGLLAYVPANLYPIMNTRSYEGSSSDTIFTGVLLLADQGSPGVALIVFVASVCIPVAKFVIIAALAIGVQRASRLSGHLRHRLHTVTELIGRWSMIDVFVVAVLAALIQLGAILTITPGVGINAFAVSVVFTMLSALSLDARLIWDTPADASVSDPRFASRADTRA